MRWFVIIIIVAALGYCVYHFYIAPQAPVAPPPPPIVQNPPPVAPPPPPPPPVAPPPPPPPVVVVKPPPPPPPPPPAPPARPDLNPGIVSALAAARQADTDYFIIRANSMTVLNQDPNYTAKVKQLQDVSDQLSAAGDMATPEQRQQWFDLKKQISDMQANATKSPAILAAQSKDEDAKNNLSLVEQNVTNELKTELADEMPSLSPASLDMIQFHAHDASVVILFRMQTPPRKVSNGDSAKCVDEIECAMKMLHGAKVQWQSAECAVCFYDRKMRRVVFRGRYLRPTIDKADFNALDHPAAQTTFLDLPIMLIADEFNIHPDVPAIMKGGIAMTPRGGTHIRTNTFATYSKDGEYAVTAIANR